MRYLVLGSSRMVGHTTALYLFEQGNEVVGFDQELSMEFPSVSGSVYDLDGLSEQVLHGKYDAVINCTAVVNNDAEQDKASAAYINSFLPHYLEKITAGTETVVVHRSTDCVFSGKRGMYGPEDVPDGSSFYARTKAIGELVNQKDITIRTSLVGPNTDANGADLLSWFMRQNGPVNGYLNAIWSGLTTIEFAREIDILVRQRAHGLLHCVPAESISKFALLELFASCMPGDRQVLPIDNERMDKSLLPALNGAELEIPSYKAMIREMAEWIDSHKHLYPHYYK